MGFTAEQRAKGLATRMANKAARDAQQLKTSRLPERSAETITASDEPKVADALRDTQEAGIAQPEQGKPETIPPNLFSGFTRRLEYFGERPGFRRRWFNDEKAGTNIGMALKSGWTMVERTEVALNAAVTPRNNDLGSHVRQYVGVDQAGQPMYAYLMEKPQWLCDQHDYGPGSRHEYHEKLLSQIRGGTLGEKAGEKRYSQANPPPGSPSTLPPITMDTKITR